jgi:hypothetical protein
MAFARDREGFVQEPDGPLRNLDILREQPGHRDLRQRGSRQLPGRVFTHQKTFRREPGKGVLQHNSLALQRTKGSPLPVKDLLLQIRSCGEPAKAALEPDKGSRYPKRSVVLPDDFDELPAKGSRYLAKAVLPQNGPHSLLASQALPFRAIVATGS